MINSDTNSPEICFSAFSTKRLIRRMMAVYRKRARRRPQPLVADDRVFMLKLLSAGHVKFAAKFAACASAPEAFQGIAFRINPRKTSEVVLGLWGDQGFVEISWNKSFQSDGGRLVNLAVAEFPEVTRLVQRYGSCTTSNVQGKRNEMPRFYIHHPYADVIDTEGYECSSVEEARAEAILGAREIIAEKVIVGVRVMIDASAIEITDASGAKVEVIPLSEVVKAKCESC